MSQQQFNPYQRNFDILRSFFSKPITLIIGILFCLQAVTGSSGGVNIQLLPILAGVAFILLYSKSRSQKPYVSYKAPIIMLKIYSIIMIVVSSLAILTLLVSTLLLTLLNSVAYYDYELSAMISMINSIFTIIPLTVPTIVFLLLQSIALLIFVNSIKKSSTTVFLQKKGSAFFAVSSILLGISEIAVSFFIVPLIRDFFAQYVDFMANYAPSTEFVNVFTPFMDNSLMPLMYVMVAISSVVCAVSATLFAILGFSYNSHIKKLTTSIGVNTPQNQEQPIQQNKGNYAEINGTPIIPMDFNPSPVFDNQTNNNAQNTSPANNTPFVTPENPYVVNHSEEHSKQCPHCGNHCPETSAFCGVCGNILN